MTDNVTVTNTISTYFTPIAGLVIAAITAFGVFYGPKMAARWQEKKRKDEEKMRTHFNDLNDLIVEQMVGLSEQVTNQGGRLVHANDQTFRADHKFEHGDLFNSFSLHFPDIADEWKRLKQKALQHNKDYEDFCPRITDHFETRGIPVVNSNQPATSPCIYDNIFYPLFQWWRDCNERNANPWPNFKKLETIPDGGPNLYVSGWGSRAIAYAETETDKEICKSAIRKVADNKDFEEQATLLNDSANEIVDDFRKLSSTLAAKITNIGKYEIGKTFKKLKECPICQRF